MTWLFLLAWDLKHVPDWFGCCLKMCGAHEPSATFVNALSVLDIGTNASAPAGTVCMACEDPTLYQKIWTSAVWEDVL